MNKRELSEPKQLLCARVGSARYGLLTKDSDRDVFILIPEENLKVSHAEGDTAFFVVSVQTFFAYWGHPLLIGDITGDCTGDRRLVSFLNDNRRAITYAAPGKTADFGLDYIAVGERYGFKSPIKAGLRTAMILSHMAEEREDPFLLSDGEKAVLIRARTGGVPPEERSEIYRRTICPANLDKLRRMPENTRVRDGLFALLDQICKEETR